MSTTEQSGYRDGGAENTVMFLHALGAWPASWDPQREALPDGWDSLAPTIGGVVGAATTPFDFSFAARRLVDELDAVGVQRAHLCGLSLGAMVATTIAIEHPDRVRSLVLSGSQVAPNRALMAVQRGLIRLLPERVVAGSGLTKPSWVAMLRAIGALDVRDALGSISVPTLVLCGSKDRPNLSGSRLIASSVPGAELQIIEGAGHLWNVQMPERFSSVIGQFYEGLAG